MNVIPIHANMVVLVPIMFWTIRALASTERLERAAKQVYTKQ